jgi:hypothetical protein
LLRKHNNNAITRYEADAHVSQKQNGLAVCN